MPVDRWRFVGGEGILPVPDAELESLVSRANAVIDELDRVIMRRNSKRETYLDSWVAANRVTWDEDFTFSQLELQTAIDELQAYKATVAAIVDAIREHNDVVRSTPVFEDPGGAVRDRGGGGSW